MFGVFMLIFGDNYLFTCVAIVGLQLLMFLLASLSVYLPFDKIKALLASSYFSEQEEEQINSNIKDLLKKHFKKTKKFRPIEEV